MATRTRWWISFAFLDLRFVVSRAADEDTQQPWLRPRWLNKRDNLVQVGSIGMGIPIPGIDRMVADYNQHAVVDGFLLLQTPAEADARARVNASHAGFVFLDRQMIADNQGHVRFEMLVEAEDDGRDPPDLINALLDATMVAPLSGGEEVTLIGAGGAIARVYETESTKTSIGFGEDRQSALKAASGTVVMTAPPIIVKIETGANVPADAAWQTGCNAPCAGVLWALVPPGSVIGATCWGFTAAACPPDDPGPVHALFGLGWLVGQFYETATFGTRVSDYQRRTGATVLTDRLRDAIMQRNRRLGRKRVGGWEPMELVSGAVAIAKAHESSGELSRQLVEIGSSLTPYIDDVRDLGGITNIFPRLFDSIKEVHVSIGNISNSNVNIGSVLTNVTQSIGAMPRVDDADRQELIKQVEAIRAALDKLDKSDPAVAEAAEAVAEKTREAVEIAAKPQPNKGLLRSALNTAKEFATGIGDVAAPVLTALTTIGAIIAKIHGL